MYWHCCAFKIENTTFYINPNTYKFTNTHIGKETNKYTHTVKKRCKIAKNRLSVVDGKTFSFI